MKIICIKGDAEDRGTMRFRIEKMRGKANKNTFQSVFVAFCNDLLVQYTAVQVKHSFLLP